MQHIPVLHKLDVGDNQISFLPPLGDLRKLEMLFLQHNQLVALPDVKGCMALKELHLADNFIKVWVTSVLLYFLLCAVYFV
jgi:Leucine-rich repeat (LRR) protein